MSIRWYHLGLIALLGCTHMGAAIAQDHKEHKHGMSHDHDLKVMPTETGQSAFAAIAEIVAILEADPKTDWSVVSIDALRKHLVDMELITMSSNVETQMLDEQRIQFKVSGEGQTVTAIQTMLPMHASMVRNETGWEIEVITDSDGATMIVNPGSEESMTKVRALGFYGFMTIGAHHQIHHLHMATGKGH